MSLPKNFLNLNEIITEATLYKMNVHATTKFSFGTWTSRQHVFVSIKAGGKYGWGENIITVNEPQASLSDWCEWLSELKGLTISDAMSLLRTKIGVWRDRMTEMTEMCLIDLAGKACKKNALEMLELTGHKPVHGMYVILSDDLAFVEQRIKWAVENNRAAFIKIKLFGRPSLDRAVIEAVRKNAPRGKTYLTGDVNGGYRMHGENATPQQIAPNLMTLFEAGLDACEDPAYLSNEDWVTLQSLCGKYPLIPDYPMRPSIEAAKTILPGMGGIYNIHPGSAGSIFDALALAKRVREIGAELMIGDDSLIGPGCTIWQQLAYGLGAAWVEATEKTIESKGFFECVKFLATDSSTAPIKIDTSVYGFGAVLDSERLAAIADEVHVI